MLKHEIIDEIEILGFPYLASLLDSNEITYNEALQHLSNCYHETTEEEFNASLFMTLGLLLLDYFDCNPTKRDMLAQLQAEADSAAHTGDEGQYNAIMKEIKKEMS